MVIMSASTHYTCMSKFIQLNLLIITTKYNKMILIGWLPFTGPFFLHMKVSQTPSDLFIHHHQHLLKQFSLMLNKIQREQGEK